MLVLFSLKKVNSKGEDLLVDQSIFGRPESPYSSFQFPAKLIRPLCFAPFQTSEKKYCWMPIVNDPKDVLLRKFGPTYMTHYKRQWYPNDDSDFPVTTESMRLTEEMKRAAY